MGVKWGKASCYTDWTDPFSCLENPKLFLVNSQVDLCAMYSFTREVSYDLGKSFMTGNLCVLLDEKASCKQKIVTQDKAIDFREYG